jgi:hypothetical protein
VQTRFRHVENGISSHYFYIDYAQLIDISTPGSSTDLTGYAKYSFGYNNFNGNGNMSLNNLTANNITTTTISVTEKLYMTSNMLRYGGLGYNNGGVLADSTLSSDGNLVYFKTGSSSYPPYYMQSGNLVSLTVLGAEEFLVDKRYFTKTTGTKRVEYLFNDTANIYNTINTTNGNFTNLSITQVTGICNLNINGSICRNATGTYIVG